MLFRQTVRQLQLYSQVFSTRGPVLNRRLLTSTSARFNASQSQQPSAYREGLARYRTFAGPFGKVFLGAVFVYQVIYWTWLKLEMDESKLEKNAEEVAVLEKKARELGSAQK